MIQIIDAGFGNVKSIGNILEHLDLPYSFVTEPKQIKNSDRLILPGVGSFAAASNILREKGFADEILNHLAKTERPFLGICVGMQVLFSSSEEDGHLVPGLNYFNGRINQLKGTAKHKLPNMGWRFVTAAGRLLKAKTDARNARFYFTHSYALSLSEARKNEFSSIYESSYADNFCCGFESENIFGVQFHPEKSHRYGIRYFEKFGAL